MDAAQSRARAFAAAISRWDSTFATPVLAQRVAGATTVTTSFGSPLRSIDGFSHMLMSDYAAKLDDGGVNALRRIRANAQRMGELIDGLLSLARVSITGLRRADVNLSSIATTAAEDVQRIVGANGTTQYVVHPGLTARGDARLLRVVLTNLVDNAFKFTRSRSDARVEVGTRDIDGERAFFVADSGVGFDMRYAGKLFGAFERLQ